jgi:histidine triad (HIT) family protein
MTTIQPSENQCVFCGIVAHNIPHHEIIWQDDMYFAFMDALPLKRGHVLVIPKQHFSHVLDMPEADYDGLMKAARKVAVPLKELLGAEYLCFVIEGRSVPHVHVHLIPLQKGESLGLREPIESTVEDRAMIAGQLGVLVR